jgi:membrane-bound lytic murein transglycosylase F
MIRKAHSFYYFAFFISISLLIWLTNHLDNSSNTQLAAILKSKELRVSTTNSEDTYYLAKNQPAGFEYDLINAFAKELGVSLALSIRQNSEQVNNDLQVRDSQIGILGRSIIGAKNNNTINSTAYTRSQTVVIYRETRGKKYPRGIENILQRSNIVHANSYQEQQLQAKHTQFPDLKWTPAKNLTTYDILEKILAKEIDYAIISASDFTAVGPFFPGLKVAFELDKPVNISWLLAAKEDDSLINRVNTFLAADKTQLLIKELEAKYYQNSNPLNFFDTITFKKNLNTRLPNLLPYFKKAAQQTNIDWLLLAAIAYQESHWDPKAVSSTGVKGIMMLTKAAAKEVNVTDRTDSKQSVFGGAEYLRRTKDKIPDRIKDPDRTFLALAGYNTGFGHLEDARVLAKRAGLNPDKWDDVRTQLPLLTKRKYFSTVKHGYARGYEPVNYVKNIRQYLTILRWEIEQQQLKQETSAAAQTPSETTLNPDTEKQLKAEPAPSTL